MIASNILEKTLLHNGMEVIGGRELQTRKRSVLSYLHKLFSGVKNGKKKSLFFFLVISLLLILVRYPLSGSEAWIYHKMDELLLIPREEPYTALYFEYYDDLPVKVASGQTVNFTFTIKNAEGFDKEYAYNIYFKNGINRKRISVDKGTVLIKNGESKTISEAYTFTQDHAQEILFVELPESGKKIHFILKND